MKTIKSSISFQELIIMFWPTNVPRNVIRKGEKGSKHSKSRSAFLVYPLLMGDMAFGGVEF